MKTFEFEEALSFMRCEMKVQGPDGKVYTMSKDGENNDIIECYPNYEKQPNWKQTIMRFKSDLILSRKWSLYEPDFD